MIGKDKLNLQKNIDYKDGWYTCKKGNCNKKFPSRKEVRDHNMVDHQKLRYYKR